jgi:hypothetical protein
VEASDLKGVRELSVGESTRDLLILTFISIRGRQQGEPKAANKFGEILVALPVSTVSGFSKYEERVNSHAKEEKERTDSPVIPND